MRGTWRMVHMRFITLSKWCLKHVNFVTKTIIKLGQCLVEISSVSANRE